MGKEQKKELNQTLSWKGETESKQKRIQLLYVCFCKWFSVGGKKETLWTCFPLSYTAASRQYLLSKSKWLLILLLMLINLLLQISTNPHLSFVCTSFHSPPFNFNCNSHHWLLLPGRITLAVEKQDESRGYTVCYFPDRKETKACDAFKKPKYNFYKENQMGDSLLGCGHWDYFLGIFGFNDSKSIWYQEYQGHCEFTHMACS